MKSLIIEIQNKLQKKDITPELLVEKSKKIIEENIHANYVITNATDLIKFNENPNPSILSNIPYSLKDLIITKNIKTTGGMKFYEDFIPPYDSTVAKLLNSCGALLVSKDNCDETGFGGSGCEGLNGPVKLSENSIYTPMGSSSGPVVSVALGSAIFSIGTDTADSIRRPACFAGVVGYKPSYGLISRYGVFSYASSCDTVGVIAKYVTDTAIVAKELMVNDGKDYSIRSLPTPLHSPEQKTAITFSVIEGIEEYLTPQVKELYLKSLEVISLKFKVVKKPLNKNLLACIPALYSIVCFSEGATNHALDTGVQVKTKFSSQEKTYEQNLIANRTNGYSDNLKRRMVLGYWVTNHENYNDIYEKAKKIRTLLNNYYDELLQDVDCLTLPGASDLTPTITSVLEKTNSFTLADETLKMANFSGYPSISIPFYTKGEQHWGINLNGKNLGDQDLLDVAATIEELFNC